MEAANPQTRVLPNQIRLKSEFQSGHQQMYLDHSVKRCWTKQQRHLDVKLQYVDQGHVSEKVTASVETLAAAGCQGIIICNSSDTEMTSAIKTCNDNKVYLSQFFRVISEENSPDIYQAAKDSEYYIGAVHEDEPANGEELVNILLEKGDRNIGLIGWEQGRLLHRAWKMGRLQSRRSKNGTKTT